MHEFLNADDMLSSGNCTYEIINCMLCLFADKGFIFSCCSGTQLSRNGVSTCEHLFAFYLAFRSIFHVSEGEARMTVFAANADAATYDFQVCSHPLDKHCAVHH